MAEVIAGVGTSHIPVIGVAMDHGDVGAPMWKPLFDGYARARRWVEETMPDVAVVIYNDHATAFSLDLVPTFAIGTGAEFHSADEGFGPRPIPVVEGHPELAWHLAESLILDGFDMTIVNEMDVDHGLTVPLSVLCGQPAVWPFPVIPLCVNVIQYPPPTAARCFQLGRSLRAALASFPAPLRVVIVGTGGMSHQLQGERAGLINSEFDRRFLDAMVDDPGRLAALDHAQYIREAGSEGLELIMWLVMRGALSDNVTEVHRHYHVPVSNTAAGLIILEETAARV